MPDPGDQRPGPYAAPDDTLARRAVTRYAVLDTPADAMLDELVDLARQLTGTRSGGIALLDRDRIWLKSCRGLAIDQVSRTQYPVSWTSGGPHADREHRTPDGVTTLRHVFTLGASPYAFWASSPIATSEGYPVGQLFVLDDRALAPTPEQLHSLPVLSRQVMANLELRRTMMSYRAAVEGVGQVVFQLDDRHNLLSVTPTWVQLTGFGVVRSVGRPFEEFVHPDDRGELLTHLQDMHDHDIAATFECRLRRLFNGNVPAEIIAKPVIDEAGARRGLVGVITDISERKAREIEAQHAQKLEALGRLSTGLAHEINTPIQFLGDNTRFLAEGVAALLDLIDTYRQVLVNACPSDTAARYRAEARAAETRADLDYLRAEMPSAIDQNLDGIDRVATLVQAMKTFSKTDQEPQARADLNEALHAAATVARTLVQQVARIDCELSDIPTVTCTIGDLNQVFLNMIVNAGDAIEDTGVFGIITIRSWLDGEHVVIEIADTGTGIPPEVQQKIFEPFFTTKEVGRGTGQGLALAHAVIKEHHGGTITVATQRGVGTTFTVTLPVRGRPPTTFEAT